MKVIYLNALVSVPKPEIEEQLSKIQDEEDNDTFDYESLGISPPPKEDGFKRDKKGSIVLKDEDFEEISVPLSIPLDNLSSWSQSLEGGTDIYTKTGLLYRVAEEVWEIDAFIEVEYMNWFRKTFLLIKSKLCKQKEQDLGTF